MLAKRFLNSFLTLLLLFSFELSSAGQPYPLAPNPSLTPGSICRKPDAFRYRERINYCERDVDSKEKQEIIKMYDTKLGYSIGRMNRLDFKIDHYIPLCMGGSNEMTNLWPQHKSVYQITDELEGLLCQKMAAGRLNQNKAIQIIQDAKNNLDRVSGIVHAVQAL